MTQHKAKSSAAHAKGYFILAQGAPDGVEAHCSLYGPSAGFPTIEAAEEAIPTVVAKGIVCRLRVVEREVLSD